MGTRRHLNSAVETEIINKSSKKPLEWKRYIDDVFSLWDTNREEINLFIVEANRHHPTIKFTTEISEKETNSLDTTVFKGEILNPLRRSNTLIFLPATPEAPGKVLSSARPLDFQEPIF